MLKYLFNIYILYFGVSAHVHVFIVECAACGRTAKALRGERATH